jgi:hypothetical protein
MAQAELSTAKVTVIIPAYNEAASIGTILARCRDVPCRVIVVDDGSTDGTDIVARDFPVTVVRNAANRGKGAALFTGMTLALDEGAEYVATLDGDGQHRPEDLPRFIECARNHSGAIVIGSRRADRAGAPSKRYRANRIADFWVSWAAGQAIDDSQSGFRLYPAAVLARLLKACRHVSGFVFESELLIEAGRQDVEIVPVPIPALYVSGARKSHFKPVRDISKIVFMVAGKLFSRGMYPKGLWRVYRGKVRRPAQRGGTSAAIAVLLLGLTACGPTKPYDVPTTAFSDPKTTQENRGEQIKRAAAGLGWTVKETGPGHLEASLLQGNQRAVVDIRFDSTAFTVHYLDNVGLSYDGTHIDPLYNQWVERLQDAVVALSSVPATSARR